MGILHALGGLRIPVRRLVAHGIGGLVMRLTIILMLRLVILAVVVAGRDVRLGAMALQIDVDAALILLGVVLQAHLAANLLHLRLDLLDVVGAVVALAHDDVQVGLAGLLGVADALLDDLLRLLYVLPVQVDGVAGDFADGIVLAEDELRGLLVVGVGLGGVLLALLGEAMRPGAISFFISLVCLGGEVLVLAVFLAREVAETIILLLRARGRTVVEG